jgi:hypothetical protein
MSRLNGRIPVEINLNAPSDRHVPVYDPQYRVWNTVDYQDIVSGSAKLSGSNNLDGNQIITGSVSNNRITDCNWKCKSTWIYYRLFIRYC